MYFLNQILYFYSLEDPFGYFSYFSFSLYHVHLYLYLTEHMKSIYNRWIFEFGTENANTKKCSSHSNWQGQPDVTVIIFCYLNCRAFLNFSFLRPDFFTLLKFFFVNMYLLNKIIFYLSWLQWVSIAHAKVVIKFF